MFCRNCGQTIAENSSFCGHCGTAIAAPSTTTTSGGAAAAPAPARAPAAVNLGKTIKEEVQARTKDAWHGVKLFLKSPVGGLHESFTMFDSRRAVSVGIVFAIVYELMVFIGLYRMAGTASAGLGVPLPVGEISVKEFFQLAFVGLVPFVTLTFAGTIARKIFRGQGSLPGDVYTAGACLLPLGFAILAASFLGAANAEVIFALLIFAWTYSILVLYTGCSRISAIPEAGAAPAVPIMLILSLWLTKVVVVGVFS